MPGFPEPAEQLQAASVGEKCSPAVVATFFLDPGDAEDLAEVVSRLIPRPAIRTLQEEISIPGERVIAVIGMEKDPGQGFNLAASLRRRWAGQPLLLVAPLDTWNDPRFQSLAPCELLAPGELSTRGEIALQRLLYLAALLEGRDYLSQEMVRANHRFNLTTQAVSGIIYDLDLAAQKVSRSWGMVNVLGFRPEDLPPTLDAWADRIHPDDRERANAEIARAVSGEGAFSFEYRVMDAGGDYRILLDRGIVASDPVTKDPHILGCSLDVTDLRNATHRLEEQNEELKRAYDFTLEGWSMALELRDYETRGHSQRVTELTLLLARELGLNGDALEHIRRGALLHDIGKMGIPDQVLRKEGPLTEEEWVVMRKHPEYAVHLLSAVDFLQPALEIPWCHHERWNGSGYPRGLQAEEIPLSARIFAVVDVWDALTSDRCYRGRWGRQEVRDYLERNKGVLFDPAIVDCFLAMELVLAD